MRVDRKLNLVLTVERDEGEAFVYSSPLHKLVFERYFLTITKTHAAMLENGPEWLIRMGPQTAKLMLKRVAEADGIWEGMEGVQRGLLSEIRRTTCVFMPTESGWDMVPLQHALDKGFFTEDDADEVENAVVFFTVGCASRRKTQADALMSTVFGLLGGSITSSTATEFQASLPTPKLEESIGVRAKQSSIPR